MPPLRLGAADSFSSSGATIVPDKRRSITHPIPHPHPPNRALNNQDSLERGLETALGVNPAGDDGMIGLLHDQHQATSALSGWSFMREFTPVSMDQSPDPLPQGHASAPPASTADYLEQLQAERANNPHVVGYRPSTSHSNYSHSSLDPSDYYSTTDMDTDDELSHQTPGLAIHSNVGDLGMGNMGLAASGHGATMDWTAFQPKGGERQGPAVISPASLGGPGVSPSDIESGLSPSAVSTGHSSTGHGRKRGGRAAAVVDESEEARAARIEHRRDINRRSAQKHRIRRKEENEVLQRKIAERDARIRQLEQELAVEKARSQTLKGFLNSGMFAGKDQVGH